MSNSKPPIGRLRAACPVLGLALGLALGVTLVMTPAAGAVDVILDVEYLSPGSGATCDGPCNRLDLYLPDEGAGVAPATVMFIHGGGWRSGDKASFAAGMNVLAEAGYPGVSVNYTLSTADMPSYPQAVHDVKAVVRWLRTTGVTEHDLPPRIVVVGSSAGGHLAMMVGATAGVEIFEPLPRPPGREGYRVNAMIPLWGVSDFTVTAEHPAIEQFFGIPFEEPPPPVYVEGSPITWVTATDPPAAFYHGLLDAVVPWQQSQIMHDALVAHGVYSEVHLDPDAGHGFGDWGGPGAMAEIIVGVIPVLLDSDREPADIDGDGTVDLADLLLLLSAWGPCPKPPAECPADINADGEVGFADLTILLSRWSA